MDTRGQRKLMTAEDFARICSNIVGFQPQIYLIIHDPIKGEVLPGPWEFVTIYQSNPELGSQQIVVLTKHRTKLEGLNELIEGLVNLLIAIPGIADLLLKQVSPIAQALAKRILERYFWGPK